jgi:protein TonB
MPNWLRFPVALAVAAVITVGMFGGLRELIGRRAETGEALAVAKVEFVRLKRSEEIEEKVREKPEREKPQQAPPDAPALQVAAEEGVDLGLDVEAIASGLGAEFGTASGSGGDGTSRGALAFNAGLSDRDPLPLVRVEPQYPPQARQRKLEGWVQVRFTISTGGAVEDAQVVKSSHKLFERPALQAVAKWKYQPQMKEGKPSEAPGQQVLLRFRMEG